MITSPTQHSLDLFVKHSIRIEQEINVTDPRLGHEFITKNLPLIKGKLNDRRQSSFTSLRVLSEDSNKRLDVLKEEKRSSKPASL